MENVIYTYGGGEILYKTFNGIACLFSNTPFLNKIVSITAVMGTVWIATRAIFNFDTGIFMRQWVIPSFLVLNLLFLPSTRVHIVDKVDNHFHYAPIDNVPLGLGVIASTASRISLLMTEAFETVFRSVEGTRYGEVGEMFPARLVEMANNIQVYDPVMRKNIKGFLNRCFLWPYIYTNVKGLKKEAKESDDILGFITTHPHSWLGTYWQDEKGKTEFKYCKDCIPLVKEALSQEVPHHAKRIACKLFNWNEKEDGDGQFIKGKLEKYFPEAWEEITGKSKQAYDVIQQYILLNSFREGLDDDREASNLPRLFPHLVGLQSARVQAHSTLASLIGADAMEAWLPSMQVAFFALLIVMFGFVMPMTFIPGGFSILVMWAKLVIWVQTWPVFFAMLNCLAMMYLAKAGRAELMDAQGNLNIGGQYGLADQAFNIYGWLKGLSNLVPVISYGVISGSSYAITQIASSVGGNLSSLAQKPAAEAVEGNISYNTQTADTLTMGSKSLGQQTLGASSAFGHSIDTGGSRLTFDPVSGHGHFEHRQSSLQTSWSTNESLGAQVSQEGSRLYQAMQESDRSYSESQSRLLQSGMSLLDQAARGKVYANNLSEQENAQFRKMADQVMRASSSHGNDHQLTNQTESENTLSGGISLKLSALGIGGEAGLNHTTSASAQNQEFRKLAKDAGWTAQQQDVWERGVQAMKGGSVDTRDDVSRQASEEYRHQLDETRNAAQSARAAHARHDNFQIAASLIEKGELASNRNLNDEGLQYIADKKFGGNQTAAFEWQQTHQDEAQSLVSQYVNDRYKYILDKAKSTGVAMSAGDIKGIFNQSDTALSQQFERVGEGAPQEFRDKVSSLQSDVHQRIAQKESHLQNAYAGRQNAFERGESSIGSRIDGMQDTLESRYKQEAGSNVVFRAGGTPFASPGSDFDQAFTGLGQSNPTYKIKSEIYSLRDDIQGLKKNG